MYKTLLFSSPHRKIFLFTKRIFFGVIMNKNGILKFGSVLPKTNIYFIQLIIR